MVLAGVFQRRALVGRDTRPAPGFRFRTSLPGREQISPRKTLPGFFRAFPVMWTSSPEGTKLTGPGPIVTSA